AGVAIQCNGRPDSAASRADFAVLARAQHGRMARNVSSMARVVGLRPFVCPHAILLVEFPGHRTGRRGCRCLLASDDDVLPEILETCQCDSCQWSISGFNQKTFCGTSTERLVALHRCFGSDFRDRLAFGG